METTNETTQPGLAPGSFWRLLSPAGQKRVLIATVREALDMPEPKAAAKVRPPTIQELNDRLNEHEAKLNAQPVKVEQLGLI